MRETKKEVNTGRSLIHGLNLIKSMQMICFGNQWSWWSLYPSLPYFTRDLFLSFCLTQLATVFPNVLMPNESTRNYTLTNWAYGNRKNKFDAQKRPSANGFSLHLLIAHRCLRHGFTLLYIYMFKTVVLCQPSGECQAKMEIKRIKNENDVTREWNKIGKNKNKRHGMKIINLLQ